MLDFFFLLKSKGKGSSLGYTDKQLHMNKVDDKGSFICTFYIRTNTSIQFILATQGVINLPVYSLYQRNSYWKMMSDLYPFKIQNETLDNKKNNLYHTT